MKVTILIICLALLVSACNSAPTDEEVLRWTDTLGKSHFDHPVDSLRAIVLDTVSNTVVGSEWYCGECERKFLMRVKQEYRIAR